MSAAFFDLDKTVIAKSSTLAFGKPFYKGGLVNRRAVLKSSFAQFVYLLQGADEDSMDKMRDYLKALCAGWDVQQVHDIVAETLHELIDPLVYAEAVDLFAEHRAAGREVVLVSSSGEEVVGPIGEMLGVDRVIATRMVVEDGRYTGDIAFYAYGEGKQTAITDSLPPRAGTSRTASPTATPRPTCPMLAGGRSPGGREPRQGAAQARGRARLAGAGLRQAGPRVPAGAHPARTAGGLRRRRCGGRAHGAGLVGGPPSPGRVSVSHFTTNP